MKNDKPEPTLDECRKYITKSVSNVSDIFIYLWALRRKSELNDKNILILRQQINLLESQVKILRGFDSELDNMSSVFGAKIRELEKMIKGDKQC